MRISVLSMPKQIRELDLDGYALGGLAVGESHEEMYRILDEDSSVSAGRKTDISDGGRNSGRIFWKVLSGE